ncbi:hypothetical protein ASPTUDRAFT_39319 [Aspergillus tubingensis CBS 134.48]|uniref:Uncharacterized protein n=1 Tax=Aspergillus tubingensis (strain CBS 134.48) TaxID=767770 RepID=A0A1L9NB06_ASPTC|nr:hypothetical protein ASPTUDRAFT_39319 [Aspergillus tubingensis CBS 134.48]
MYARLTYLGNRVPPIHRDTVGEWELECMTRRNVRLYLLAIIISIPQKLCSILQLLSTRTSRSQVILQECFKSSAKS